MQETNEYSDTYHYHNKKGIVHIM